MNTTLRRDLLGILIVGVLVAFGLQLVTRVNNELPALYLLEAEADRGAVDQVRESLSHRVETLEKLALDYSLWDESYGLAESTPGSPEYDQHLAVIIPIPWDSFFLYDVNGVIFFDSDGIVLYRHTLDLETGEPRAHLDLTNAALLDTLTTRYRSPSKSADGTAAALINSGFAATEKGTVVFASAEIHRSDITSRGDSRGTLVFWRYLDEKLLQPIETTLGIELDLLSIRQMSAGGDLDEMVASLANSPGAVSPREDGEHLHWLLRDGRDEPLMLVRQKASPRSFDERWVTASVLVFVAAFGFLMVLIGVFLSKRIVNPIAHLRDVALRIGEGDLDVTSGVSQGDEIGELSQSINLMSSRLREARANLVEFASTDFLTGLRNRRVFVEFLAAALETARRRGTTFGLLFIDLDDFKIVNDSAGHEAGDYVLQEVAKRLVDCLRGEDVVARANEPAAIEGPYQAARFGGDEFTVLLSDLANPSAAGLVAERIRAALQGPYSFEGTAHQITCSVGITIFPEDGEDPIELIKRADYAMYTAKLSGKDKFCYYDPVTSAQATERLRIRNALSGAIEREQFHLVYQPLYEVRTRRIIGCEALLRWDWPEGEFMSPGVFIPIAEDAGLMKEIGQWVLEEACRQQRDWQEQGIRDLRVNINVSAHQFSEMKFHQQVEASLNKYRLSPESLRIEITETAMLKASDEVRETLQRLSDIGVTISLDDFGTGYSSLSLLRMLPIDDVKIDTSFIDAITSSSEGKPIVKAVIAMCKELDLSITAEGVEVEAQLSFLQGLDCDFAQGYLLSRPVTADVMGALVSETAAVSSSDPVEHA